MPYLSIPSARVNFRFCRYEVHTSRQSSGKVAVRRLN
jgi:hypothetical protein